MIRLKNNKIFILLVSLLFFLAGCDEKIEGGTYPYEKAEVVKVIDGDTLRVKVDGASHKLRMVGIDTPEIDNEDGTDDYYGRDAYIYSNNLLDGQTVYLEMDTSDTDQYDRLIRYVWVDLPENPDNPSLEDLMDKSVNGRLAAGGYAYVYAYPPDDKYYDELKNLEKVAKERGLGIWDYDAKSDFEDEFLQKPIKDPIRGNKNSMIYHLPGGEGYDQISEKNIIEFESEDEARRAGFRKARN